MANITIHMILFFIIDAFLFPRHKKAVLKVGTVGNIILPAVLKVKSLNECIIHYQFDIIKVQ